LVAAVIINCPSKVVTNIDYPKLWRTRSRFTSLNRREANVAD
jgi:hypothetical protein